MAISPDTEAVRRRQVAWAIAITADTPLAPRRYEQYLLNRYQQGELTIEQVEELLAQSIYHVFYRSQATFLPDTSQLAAILDWSRAFNAQHHITGLLLYSDGLFAQVIEGPEAEVCALFASIRQDARHQHIVTISDGPGPQRWFADWQMAFGHVESNEFAQTLRATETNAPVRWPIDDPHLQTLVEAFNLAESTNPTW